MDSPLANKQWEKYTWKPGEEITDVKLNAIEQKLEDLAGPAMHAIRYDIEQDLDEQAKKNLKKNLNLSPDFGSHAMGENDKNKAYILGTTTAPVADGEVTATMVADPGVYLDTYSGSLTITGAFSQGRKANTEVGTNSFASGVDVEASGFISHAEGNKAVADGDYSHAEGLGTHAYGQGSHAEGVRNIARGTWSHIEGGTQTRRGTIVLSGSGDTYTYVEFPFQLTVYDKDRFYVYVDDDHIFFVKDIDTQSKTITLSSFLSNDNINQQSFQLYTLTGMALGTASHVEGYDSVAQGSCAHAEGNYTNAEESYSHAEGYHTRSSGSMSHAEGNYTNAKGAYSHAEGSWTSANNDAAHAEGSRTRAEGVNSHAEGCETLASVPEAHAEGLSTSAKGAYSHAEGFSTVAQGTSSHAEGNSTNAYGDSSHAEGEGTIAQSQSQHVFGKYNNADSSANDSAPYGNYVEIVGNGTDDTNRSNARTLDWEGNETLTGSLTIGTTLNHGRKENTTIGADSFAFGTNVTASGELSHAEGYNTIALSTASHAEGYGGEPVPIDHVTLSASTIGNSKFVFYNKAPAHPYWKSSYAQNWYILYNNTYYAITELNTGLKRLALDKTITLVQPQEVPIYFFTSAAINRATHAEGNSTIAFGPNSHAEGLQTVTVGSNSHSEGQQTKTIGNNSHAEGWLAVAEGQNSHAEGYSTSVDGENSHAEGENTIAKNKSQHVFGRYNEADSSTNSSDQYGNYIEIVGNGPDQNTRKNARTLDWNGNEWLAGTLTAKNIDGTSGRMLDAFVQGTQNKAQAGWLGTAPFAALNDKQIIYYWLPRDSADGGVTLKLTLSDGSTTDAIPVYTKGDTRAGSAYKANSFIIMMYRENIQISTNNTIAKGWWICA